MSSTTTAAACAGAGFERDDAPRAVIPSIVGRPTMPGIMVAEPARCLDIEFSH